MGREPRDGHPAGKMTSLIMVKEEEFAKVLVNNQALSLWRIAIPRCTDETQTSVLNQADKTDDIVDDQEAMLEN